jgi:hypothetical protein
MMRNLLTGLVAGLASALLFASMLSGSPLSLLLCLAAPLPIMIVGLGWRHRAGLVAAVVASVLLGIGLSDGGFDIRLAVAFLASTALPAWLLSYLALLGRHEAGGAVVEWFPIGTLVVATALISAAITMLIALSFGFTFDAYSAALGERVEAVLRIVTDTPDGQPIAVPNAAAFVVFAKALALPISTAIWVFTTLFNLWLAARVVKASSRLARPWPDVPSSLRLPRRTILALGLAVLVATFAPGMVGLAGEFVTAGLVAAFAIAGYATLHGVTRGMTARPLVLGACYAITLVLSWIAIIAAVVAGLADHLLDFRGRVAARRKSRPANDNS